MTIGFETPGKRISLIRGKSGMPHGDSRSGLDISRGCAAPVESGKKHPDADGILAGEPMTFDRTPGFARTHRGYGTPSAAVRVQRNRRAFLPGRNVRKRTWLLSPGYLIRPARNRCRVKYSIPIRVCLPRFGQKAGRQMKADIFLFHFRVRFSHPEHCAERMMNADMPRPVSIHTASDIDIKLRRTFGKQAWQARAEIPIGMDSKADPDMTAR